MPGCLVNSATTRIGRQGEIPQNYGNASPCNPHVRGNKVVVARFIHNDRLTDALMAWALLSLNAAPRARAFYDGNAPKIRYNGALGRLANRLVGILHGCLKSTSLAIATAEPVITFARNTARYVTATREGQDMPADGQGQAARESAGMPRRLSGPSRPAGDEGTGPLRPGPCLERRHSRRRNGPGRTRDDLDGPWHGPRHPGWR